MERVLSSNFKDWLVGLNGRSISSNVKVNAGKILAADHLRNISTTWLRTFIVYTLFDTDQALTETSAYEVFQHFINTIWLLAQNELYYRGASQAQHDTTPAQ